MEHRLPYVGPIVWTPLDYVNLGMTIFLLSQAVWHFSGGGTTGRVFGVGMLLAALLVLIGTVGLGRKKYKIYQWLAEQRNALEKLKSEAKEQSQQ